MAELINKQDENTLRKIVKSAIRDYIHDCKQESDYWSKQDEEECKNQVREEVIGIIQEATYW